MRGPRASTLEELGPSQIPQPGPAPEKPPYRLLAGLITGGALVGPALNSFLDGPNQSYHFAHEGWFGQNTYAGGADKASHFVTHSLVSKEFANLCAVMGSSAFRSPPWDTATTSTTGEWRGPDKGNWFMKP